MSVYGVRRAESLQQYDLTVTYVVHACIDPSFGIDREPKSITMNEMIQELLYHVYILYAITETIV
jgi:hypothetical protein